MEQNNTERSTMVTLDGVQVSRDQFDEKVRNLKPNQRIVESGNHQFVVVERLFD